MGLKWKVTNKASAMQADVMKVSVVKVSAMKVNVRVQRVCKLETNSLFTFFVTQ